MAEGGEDIDMMPLDGGIKNEDLEETTFHIPLKDDIDIIFPNLPTGEIGTGGIQRQENLKVSTLTGEFYRNLENISNTSKGKHKFKVDRNIIRGEFKLESDELIFIGRDKGEIRRA